jgi:ATP-binding cassette subfamily B protein
MISEFFGDASPERRFLIPEVVQTSAMDCGPASLKALLAGFDIRVNYGHLREACMTDVDGTSIDTLEEIAVALGLDAIQTMVPADHLLLSETQALPALVIVRLPNGLTHFVVVWRAHRFFVQIMDPGAGRAWWTRKGLLNDLYLHALPIDEDFAHAWISGEAFLHPLQARLLRMDICASQVEELIQKALQEDSWQAIAALDAATRLTETFVRTKGILPGREAAKVLRQFADSVSHCPSDALYDIIPESYWSIRRSPEDENALFLHGAVLIQVFGKISEQEDEEGENEGEDEARETGATDESDGIYEQGSAAVSPKLSAALRETEASPGREIIRILLEKGRFFPLMLAATLLLTSLGMTIEALLLKGVFDISRFPELMQYRGEIAIALYAFFAVMLMLELSGTAAVTRMGQRLEIRFMVSILQKIPRLGDRYFHSRLTSDMSQRVYELRQLRDVPELAVTAFRTVVEIVLTTAGVIWLYPAGAGIAVLTSTGIIALSLLTQSWLKEQDLRFRTHIGALSRFYLDALLGLVPIRTHRAERSISIEHENMLVKWSEAGMAFYTTNLAAVGVQALTSAVFAIWILFSYLRNGGDAGGVLLLLYWIMKLPVLGQSLAGAMQQYPMQHNRVLRLLEMRDSSEETETWYKERDEPECGARTAFGNTNTGNTMTKTITQSCGVHISMDTVQVRTGGQSLLRDIDLDIAAGEHLAVVGPSGAGKSSLAGVLLGWHRPSSGTVQADNELLHNERLYRLRRETAWVDPGIQLWNRSLEDNLHYGSRDGSALSLEEVMQQADLAEVLAGLQEGIRTPLGESGGLLSGGQGQRVRLGRAMLRPDTRLVILDEPFRGLDRKKRKELLQRCRRHWRDATLIFISHDIDEALAFNRVLVVEDGRIIEDNAPEMLANDPDSRYYALQQAEKEIQRKLHENELWRHWVMEKGRLTERGRF